MSDAPIAPTDVLNAHGLHAHPMLEPHAREGNHIRMTSHPLLGMPVAPLMFWRGEVDQKGLAQARRDVVYLDAAKPTPLEDPVEVTPGRPIEVRFPTVGDETCIFARVVVDTNLFTVDMFIPSARGPVFAGRRTAFPYSFSAPSIDHLVIHSTQGTRRVMGVEWFELTDFPDVSIAPWTITNLPSAGSARYLQVPSWEAEVDARVREQGPKRRPLHESTGRPDPSTAPPVVRQFEVDRVDSLMSESRTDHLPALLSDLSRRQRDMEAALPIVDDGGAPLPASAAGQDATATVNRVGLVLQGTLDPGVASGLGFKAFDPWQDQARIMIYWVEALFEHFTVTPHIELLNRYPLASLIDERQFATRLSVAAPQRTSSALTRLRVDRFLSAVGRPSLATSQQLDPAKEYIRLAGWCVIDEEAPLEPPSPPQVIDARHIRWLPIPPPAARRETRLDIAGIEGGALLAIDRSSADGSHRLNAENPDGFHLPIVLGVNAADGSQPDDMLPGEGFVTDPRAEEGSLDYGIAQQDRFGRWSKWASAVVPHAARPGPPVPVFQAHYLQPDANQEPIGVGDIRIIAQIPEPASLAPASFPVRVLHVDRTIVGATVLGVTTTTTHVVPSPTGVKAGDTLAIDLVAPPLDRTASMTMRIRARWEDTSGTIGADSTDQLLELVDPRPPLPVAVPDVLTYTGRPDVTGLAWAEHRWQPTADQARAVLYYADEGRVRSMLERAGKTAFLSELDGAVDDPARASVYRTRGAELTAAYFERVNGAIVDHDDGSLGFRHAVSGSLAGFSLYRIGTESHVGAASPIESLDTIVFSVPNSDPPSPPIVEVRQDESATAMRAVVSIRWEPGATPVERYRLRRSRAVSTNPLRMPVVTVGTVTPEELDSAVVDVVDAGPVQIAASARLRPWTLYSWVAEVQGPPEPGSVVPVAGRWSAPSAPFGMVLTPPGPPQPVVRASASGTARPGGIADVSIRFDHPDDLDGGAVGPYRLVVLRQRPGAMTERVGEYDISGTGPHTIDASRGPDDLITADTIHTLTLLDPLGRPSTNVQISSVRT